MIDTQKEKEVKKDPKKENMLLNIGCNVIIPSLIMTKLSKPEYLGQVYGLVVALLFPFTYGVIDLINKFKPGKDIEK